MILVNKIQVSLEELSKRLGKKIPLDKIKKKPLYEINPALIHKDPANGPGAVKLRNAMEFPAYFRVRLDSGEDVEIRYATNRTPDPKTFGQGEKFAPRALDFEGKAEFIADDLDKAVYFFMHFYCKTSPFRDISKPYEYELVDDDAKAEALIQGLTLKGKATSHAAALSGDEMIIIAKGMKIPGASSMEPLMIKAQLMQYASDKPAEYLNLAESNVNHVHGLIYDAIDKGVFVLENVFNSKRWKWGKGPKAGELITEMSSKVQDDREALIQHIAQTPGVVNEILPVLMNTMKNLNAQSNLEKAIGGQSILEQFKNAGQMEKPEYIAPPAPPVVPPIPAYIEPVESEVNQQNTIDEIPPIDDEFNEDDFDNVFPENFEEAKQYLFEKIGKKTPALASKLLKGIESGEITTDNIAMHLEEYKTA